MTRAEYVAVCRQCKNRSFDVNQGVTCGLTNKIADFHGQCAGFVFDEQVVTVQTESSHDEVEIQDLGEDVIEKLRINHNFNFAIAGGLIAMLVSAIVWAVISVIVEAQIGYMAIGAGIVTGMAIRFFGAGIDKKFQILGAVLATTGCLLGNLLTQIGFIAQMQQVPFLYILSLIGINDISTLMTESFQPVDLLFYVFSAVFGFRYSVFRITPDLLERIKTGTEKKHEIVRNKLRMPLAIAGMIVILLVIFNISGGYSGPLTERNEAGIITSSGELRNNKMHGHWINYYPNSVRQSEGNYIDGEADGMWKFYNEDGTLRSVINYRNNLENGAVINYYPNGKMADSMWFVNGRADGTGKAWFETGILSGILHKKRDILDGEMRIWNEAGQLASVLNYVNDTALIIEQYDKNGKPMVMGGNGVIRNYYDNGKLQIEFTVRNGRKYGKSQDYYPDGTLRSVGEYVDDRMKLLEYRSPDGQPMVLNGTGRAIFYDTDSSMTETNYLNGFPDGSVNEYYKSGALKSSAIFKNGKENGQLTHYNENGSLLLSCTMKDGEMDGESIWYNENGAIESKATFINGKKTGIQTFYALDGTITKQEFWSNGKFVREEVK